MIAVRGTTRRRHRRPPHRLQVSRRRLLLSLACLAVGGFAWADDWLQLGGTAARTGTSAEALEPGSGAGWSATTGATFRGGAVDAEVWAGSRGDLLHVQLGLGEMVSSNGT